MSVQLSAPKSQQAVWKESMRKLISDRKRGHDARFCRVGSILNAYRARESPVKRGFDGSLEKQVLQDGLSQQD